MKKGKPISGLDKFQDQKLTVKATKTIKGGGKVNWGLAIV